MRSKSDAMDRVEDAIYAHTEPIDQLTFSLHRKGVLRAVRALLKERAEHAATNDPACSCCGGRLHEPMRAWIRAAVLRPRAAGKGRAGD